MNKKILLTMAGLVPMVLASCNGNTGIGRINRDVYKEVNYDVIEQRYNSITSSQFTNKESRTGIKLKDNVKNGVMTHKYSFYGKGTMRYLDLTLHNVDAHISAGFILSWDLDKEILKVEGEDETHFFLKADDNKYYHCEDYVVDGVAKHHKEEITVGILEETLKNDTEFETYVGDTIDYYTAFFFPFAFSFSVGITGCYDISLTSNELPQFLPFEYSVEKLFSKETHDLIENFNNNEEWKNKGYNLKTIYGSYDEKSMCTSIAGKGRIEAIHATEEKHGFGDFNIDLFASYKNNFVNQFEIGFNCDRHQDEAYHTNYKIHYEFNLLQDLKAGEYKPDSVDLSNYND